VDDQCASLQVHGGGVKTSAGFPFSEAGEFRVINGRQVEFRPEGGGEQREYKDFCPAPLCLRTDPQALHIYHYRISSLDDAIKKWQAYKRFTDSDLLNELYQEMAIREVEKEYVFFNQIRDIALAIKFHHRLAEKIRGLMH
jgi:hypothetical protein